MKINDVVIDESYNLPPKNKNKRNFNDIKFLLMNFSSGVSLMEPIVSIDAIDIFVYLFICI